MKTYEVIKSAPYCCVCAIVETIAQKHGYKITQYDVANYIGLVCSEEDLSIIPKEIVNIKTTNNPKDWGVHLDNDTLTQCFKFYNVPLKETFIPASQFDELNLESLLAATSDEYDVLFFLSHGILYGIEENIEIGHCVLYVNKLKNSIQYLDPGPSNFGFNTRDIYDVYIAIKKRIKMGGGISIISRI